MTATTGNQALLKEMPVGKIAGRFFVPGYQRGYRWGAEEVNHLLEDIYDSQGRRYHLQPVVVKPRHVGEWELIDGQQRLTTLYLILRYIQCIQPDVLPPGDLNYSLDYETRSGSPDYLENPVEERHKENIDYFHIYQADRCIRAWFDGKPNKAQAAIDFYNALSKSVYVIWYQAPAEMDSTELFTRLNAGRIPLTDAELVKALLLSPQAGETREADRRIEMGAHWDAIERDLQVPEVWAFVAGSRQEPTHITLLLDTLAGGETGKGRPPFHTFETLREEIDANRALFWNRVADLHSLVIGWYEDRDLYHRIGLLVTYGTPFGELVDQALNHTRSSFISALDERIKQRLNMTETKVRELTYKEREDCNRVLLLMNVETARLIGQVRQTDKQCGTCPTARVNRESSQRYSFKAHATGPWSLEHIHAALERPHHRRTVERVALPARRRAADAARSRRGGARLPHRAHQRGHSHHQWKHVRALGAEDSASLRGGGPQRKRRRRLDRQSRPPRQIRQHRTE